MLKTSSSAGLDVSAETGGDNKQGSGPGPGPFSDALQPQSISTTDDIMRALQNLKGDPDRMKKAQLVADLKLSRTQALEEERLEFRATLEERCQVLANFGSLMITQPGNHDIIEEILSHVQDSKERVILSNMSEVWADILKPSCGTTSHFHAVVPILLQEEYIGQEEMKAIRGTCREWRDSLDQYLRDSYTHGQYTSKLEWPPQTRQMKEVLNLTFPPLPYDPEQFSEWSDRLLDESRVNPFFAGKVYLTIHRDWVENREFKAKLKVLLRQAKSKLIHVTFVFRGVELCDMYEALYDYLKLVPQTKFLVVEYYPQDRPSKFGSDQLKLMMNKRKLPRMKELTHLYALNLPTRIREKMLAKYGTGLESLMVNPQGPDSTQTHCSRDGFMFPNLKIFKFSCHGAHFAEADASQDWPVEEVDCKLENVEIFSVPNIFRNLGNFRRTLRKLTITLERKVKDGLAVKVDRRTQDMLWLDLPLVEEFTLCASGINLATMDFILPMGNLKMLDVTYVKYVEDFGMRVAAAPAPVPAPEKRDHNHIIQYSDRLHESNIWNLFPKLSKVVHNIIYRLKPHGQARESLEELRLRHPTMKIDESGGEFGTSRRRVYTREENEQYCKGTRE